jgi:hypothetical protein
MLAAAMTAPERVEPRTVQLPLAEAIVIVTLDGVRWREIFEGTDADLAVPADLPRKSAAALMPTLSRWMTADGASIGAPGRAEISASGPNFVSLPGYFEIFSGRSPSACQSNSCGDIAEATLFDDVEAQYSGESVAVVSSWESIAHAASGNPASHLLLSTGRVQSRGLPAAWLAQASGANPWPGGGEYRPDALTGPIALRVLQEAQPKAMFIGLGDTDEYAHHGDYAGYIRALESADAFLFRLETTLAAMGERGARTSVFVTCDHGRSSGFNDHGGAWAESGRVWLVAHGSGIGARGAVDAGRPVRLADIAATARELIGASPDTDARAGRPIEALLP